MNKTAMIIHLSVLLIVIIELYFFGVNYYEWNH